MIVSFFPTGSSLQLTDNTNKKYSCAGLRKMPELSNKGVVNLNTESPEPPRMDAPKTMIAEKILFAQIMVAALMITMTACAGSALYEINLMPAPDVYDEGAIDPFTDIDPISEIPYSGILYATKREPAEGWQKEHFYLNRRGHALRLGVGQITLGQEGVTWEWLRVTHDCAVDASPVFGLASTPCVGPQRMRHACRYDLSLQRISRVDAFSLV